MGNKKAHYNWDPLGPPPSIKQHSIAKHEILRAYLLAYIQTLLSGMQRRDVFKLTLVDGFAGGGVYSHAETSDIILGSPLVMLEAVNEAAAIVNCNRTNPVNFQVDYFFVEKNRGAIETLDRELRIRGYESQLDKSIFLRKSEFQNEAEEIKRFIFHKSPRGTRAIFLLDQYGFGQVPTGQINNILSSLPGAEVILTFAVNAFLTYASDDELTEKKLRKLGIPQVLRGRTIKEIKENEKDWRLFIQSCMYQDLVAACGAKHYTPFFIRSSGGHGDYWLIHLSQKPRARDVMTKIHWEKCNHFIHYGDAGLDMFQMAGYIPKWDKNYTYNITGQKSLGFEFGEEERRTSVQTIARQLPEIIYPNPNGITFGELFAGTCNETPAHSDIYREAAGILLNEKDIEIVGEDGARRRSANRIHDTDRILRPSQYRLFT
jgi:three-Cys-motif partner protein